MDPTLFVAMFFWVGSQIKRVTEKIFLQNKGLYDCRMYAYVMLCMSVYSGSDDGVI